jgi:CRISPR-associated protein Csx14
LATTPTDATRDPFAVSSTSKSAFSLDARVGGSALDAGFSADQHASIRSVRFPLVEMLAVVGLENARPLRVSRTAYRYGISNLALPCALARAVLGGAAPGFAVRRFAFTLTEPNDYSRLIRDVYEITGEPP